jgi:tetratricopeptide (TPR) repeat protein
MFSVGSRLGVPEAEMEELYRECTAIAEQSGSDEARCQLLMGYGLYRMYVTGNARDAADSLGEALELADQIANLNLQIQTRFALGSVHVSSDPGRVLELSDEGLALLREHPEARSMILPVGYMPDAGFGFLRFSGLNLTGRRVEANEVVRELKRLGEDREDAAGLAVAAAQMQANTIGDLAAGEIANASAIEISEASGNLSAVILALQGRGELLRLRGKLDEALVTFERMRDIHRDFRALRQLEPLSFEGIARVHLDAGQLELAQENAEAMRAICDERGLTIFLARTNILLAEIAIARDGAAEREFANDTLGLAAEIVEQTGARILAPLVHEARAKLGQVSGDAAEYERELREALRLHEEVGNSGQARRLRDELARA